METDINIIERSPTLKEFTALRRDAGWKMPADSTVTNALKNTLFSVCAVTDAGDAIGCGNITGDGFMYFYLSDIIVKKEYQERGVGKMIMHAVQGYIDTNAPAGAFVGLCAAHGKEGFYKKLGFIERPNEYLGAGMVQFIPYPEQG